MPTHITPDGTLGTRVTQNGRVHTIAEGTIKGPNLFHSFTRFTVGTGDTARFTGPQTGITNILSRVTGGQQSVIDGRLQSGIPGANLYLLNPSGVLFGPNASLDISGSFHVSTADGLRFADGATFSAHLGEDSVLTVAPPAAFGFLQESPAAIAIQGSQLHLPVEGATLSLVGGDITIEGGGEASSAGLPQLFVRNGRITITSIASPGDVGLVPSASPEDTVARRGTVTLSTGARILNSSAGRGTVAIRGGRVLLDNATVAVFEFAEHEEPRIGVELHATEDIIIRQPGGEILTQQFGAARAGDIRMTAERLQMQDGARLTSVAEAGRGGDLLVAVGQLTLTTGAQIVSTTIGTGQGGSVVVTAADTITFTGRASADAAIRSGISLLTADSGAAGHITLRAPTVRLEDGGVIETNTILGSGRAGDIVVEVERLSLTNGSTIDTTTFLGSGQGGTVSVRATDTVTIAGSTPATGPSGLFSRTDSGGDAGNMTLSAATVVVHDQGRIDAIALGSGRGGGIALQVGSLTLTGGAQINSSAIDAERGGSVQITALDTVILAGQESGLFTNAEGRSAGGDITLEAHTIQLTEAARVAAQSSGAGNAGVITITSHDTFVSEHGAVTTEATQATGGDILLQAPLVNLRDSVLTAAARGAVPGLSDGGNVTIRAGFVILDGSQVRANAFGGNGGSITIAVEDAFLADTATCANQACLDASSRLGVAGTVEVSTPTADLSGVVTPLPQSFTPATALLPQRCAERLQGQPVSTFVLAGRDSLPAQPGGVLPSPLVAEGSERTQRGPDKARGHGVPGVHHGKLGVDAHGRPRVQGWPVPGMASLAWDAACPQGDRGQDATRTHPR